MIKKNKNLPFIFILDQLPTGVCVVDSNFTVIAWNHILTNWSKIKETEIQNKNLLEEFPHLKQARFLNRMKMVITGGHPVIFSVQLNPYFFEFEAKGKKKCFETFVSRLTSDNQTYLLIYLQDMSFMNDQLHAVTELRKQALLEISERKKAEKILENTVKKLTNALAEVKSLQEIIPICSHCKKIRDDKGYWNNVDDYLSRHSSIEFTHGLCPSCMRELYPEFTDKDGNII